MRRVTADFLLEHIGLPAANAPALAGWYVRSLGGEVIHAEGETRFVRLPGGTVLEIYTATATSGRTGDNGLAGFRHLALRVAAIEPARDALAARGVKFHPDIKPAGGGGRVLFFADAEGNLLHLVERSADSKLK
jgi:catechol 2,3-dioxygenase-like lactoylglutathione lyase family enzyme